MANVFRSKEVYKKIPKVSPDENPLRAVRGIYVSGAYRPAYYIDAFIHISNINTTKATIADYTERSTNITDDGAMRLVQVKFDDLVLTEYTREHKNITDDGAMRLVQVKFDDESVYWFNNKPIETNKDFMIRIKSITSTHAIITNYE
jgi:plasmid maintenance system antidote protein VapI